MRVLDTAALLNWPLSKLQGSVVHSQRDELLRIAKDREYLIEAAQLDWQTPSMKFLEDASSLATSTGDIAGLSAVDIEILALTLQLGAILITDDYRLQNCCVAAGIDYEPVITEGVSEQWKWKLVCTGCGVEVASSEVSTNKGGHGDCPECGSPYKMRKC